MDTNVEVFICGSGSAGLCAATWLAICGITCKIVDSRPGPLEIGQADGVQCRTVEVFDSFGIAEELLRESYHVIEVAFWAASKNGGIQRKSRAADTPPGLSWMPHVILNQARVNKLLLDAMERSNGQRVEYGCRVTKVEVDAEAAKDPGAFCVQITTQKVGVETTFRAKYALVSAINLYYQPFLNYCRVVTERIVRCGGRSVLRWSVTEPTRSGASWMFIHEQISRILERSARCKGKQEVY